NNQKEDLINKLRSLPYNIDAEQILLGSIIINSDQITQFDDFLKIDHFFMKLHRKIYTAILTLIDKELVVSIITINSLLKDDNSYIDIGAEEYLLKLATISSTVIKPLSYAKMIYDLSVKRNLIKIGEDIVNKAYDNKSIDSAKEQLEEAEDSLYNLAVDGINEKSFEPIKEATIISMDIIDKAIKNKGEVTGISTGLIDLNSILSGFHNSDLVILAGRPGMGKTAFAVNFAINASEHLNKQFNKNNQEQSSLNKSDDNDNGDMPSSIKNNQRMSVGIFSLEMSSDQLSTRIISIKSGIESSNLKKGNIGDEQYSKIKEAANQINNMNIFIDDSPALTIATIRTRARKLKRKHNLGILFIDYLQLISGSSGSENRVQEISEITRSLKALAKELNIPIIALSQLSRSVEQREDKRPMLSDLRESGSIEQDADVVMFVYREEYYLNKKMPAINESSDQDKKIGQIASSTKNNNYYNSSSQVSKANSSYQSEDSKYRNNNAKSETTEEWQRKYEQVKNKAQIIVAKHRSGAVGNINVSYFANISKIANSGKSFDESHGLN
ncbi:MAG TPA: replicative DNA helicase, partial [Candidatus Megaira endosymbiont of Hartmannula sinica]|nr:replicative DNA helicase [Candidatus Megaera endosymbiont of Hartmannula sinica]